MRIWDPATSEQLAVLEGHENWVNGVRAVTVADRELLASASGDQTVRIWDPAAATSLLSVPVRSDALAICRIGDSLAIGLAVGVLVIGVASLP